MHTTDELSANTFHKTAAAILTELRYIESFLTLDTPEGVNVSNALAYIKVARKACETAFDTIHDDHTQEWQCAECGTTDDRETIWQWDADNPGICGSCDDKEHGGW